MTREELIEHIKYSLKIGADVTLTEGDAQQIIKALERKSCDVPDINVGNMISRQKAIDAIDALYLDGDSPASHLANAEGDTLIGKYQAITALDDLPSVKPQEPKTEKVIKMREATPEEREIINKHIKSISKPTGVNFWNLYKEPCEDAISRQDALRAFMYATNGERLPDYDCDNYPVTYDLRYIKKTLRALPPVTPQSKTGHWINNQNGTFECDQCGYKHSKSRFCPNCGTKMQEGEE